MTLIFSKTIRITAILILVIGSTGCLGGMTYSGDGSLIDNGFMDGQNRYILNLGELTLTKMWSHTYTIGELPVDDALIGSVKFVVGIEIQMPPEGLDNLVNKTINPDISLELTKTDGSVLIIGEQSFLNSWTWTVDPKNVVKFTGQATAFIYKGGDRSTYFVPSKNESYILKLQIHKPDDSGLKYTARLVAKSGGWK